MAFISDNVLDSGLSFLTATSGIRMDLCSQEPATRTEAISTYTLANATDASIGSAGNASPNGRKVTVAAVSGGSVTSTASATHWALSSTGELLAASTLSADQSLTSGNTFSTTAFDIRFPDPS